MFCRACARVQGRMQRLKLRHPALCEGWIIVKRKLEIIKKGHSLSMNELKKKMEKCIKRVVCKSVLEEEFKSGSSRRNKKPFANRKTMKCVILQQRKERERKLEERKRKLIQDEQLKQLRGGLKTADEHKLRNVCGKLKKDQRHVEASPGRGRRRNYQGEHSRGVSCEVFGRLLYGE